MSIKYTDEQKTIIQSKGDIRVIAAAGSGKTSTIFGYAKERPKDKKLYVVFNATVRDEALEKSKKEKIENLTIMTAHSMAYRADNFLITGILKYAFLSNVKLKVENLRGEIHFLLFLDQNLQNSPNQCLELNLKIDL